MEKKAETPSSVNYSFTVTLKPHHYRKKAEEQYDLSVYPLLKHLSGYKVTLIAEETQNCNLHFHGTISVPDCTKGNTRKIFIDSFRASKDFGFVSIKQIDNEPGWVDYISKDFKQTTLDLGRRPIIKDDFNYFNDVQHALFGTTW